MANKRFIDFPIATTVGDNDIILIWQSGANKQTTKATILSGVPDSLNDLTDVTISGLTNGQILRYDSVSGQWENTDQGNLDLNDLNDVTIVSPTNGQVLVYNSSTSKWENSSGGYVPYVGAVTTVNLGAQTIQAGSFVKQGGTASQFLKANGSVDSTAYGTGSVTSVGLTMPSAFNVANSPITTAGTLAVTGAGTVAQYIRGDGSLADFPESSGGGSSVSYYLNGSVAQGTIGGIAYNELSKVPILGAGTDFTINADGYIASFITDAGDPNLLEIPGGNWNFETYFSASSGGGSPTFYVELYKVNAGGTATLIASSSTSPELIAFGTNLTPYFSSLAVPTTTLALTDRLAVRYYVTHSGRTITLHTENNHLCQIITTFTTGLTALNGLTAQVQNFAVGTTGTDFNIASAVSTHTFNLPTASATNRGALSSADWALFTQAYNDKINSAAVTGTTTKTLTLTQQDGGTITASWSDLNTDAVLSVFGRTGNVIAVSGDYTTAQVTESGNLYYTDGRARGSLSFAAGSGAYNTSTGVITIPTNNNQITNGAGYITSAALAGYLPLTGGTLTGPLGVTGNLTLIAGGSGPSFNRQISLGSGTAYNYQVRANGDDFQLIEAGSHVFLEYDYGGSLGTGTIRLYNNTVSTGSFTANSFTKIGGTSSQFLKADGSVDSTAYGTGTVTSVTASSPLASSGGTTPNITIQQASGSTNGALSSTDWTTFNSKQNALTNPVTGTGTTNYLPKFTGSTTIGNSALYDGGGFGGFNSTGLGVRTFVVQAASSRPLVLELVENSGVHSVYIRPNVSGYNLITSNYNGGGVYLPLSLSGRENNADLVLQTSGNVSIGTTSDAGFKLDVNGTGRFTSNLYTSTALYINTTAAYGFRINSEGNNGFYNRGGSTVSHYPFLLENSSGALLFQVQGTGAATFSSSVNVGGVSANTDFRIYRTVAPSVYFSITAPGGTPNMSNLGVNGTDVMSLTANGNVLIGTTTDSGARLNVQTSGSAVGGIRLTSGTNTNGSAFVASNAGGDSYFGRNSSTGGAFTGDAYSTVVYGGGNYPMGFYTNDTLKMTITSGGNVGIGTPSPLTRLDCQIATTGTLTENAAFRDSSTNGNALQIWNGNNEARLRAVYYGTPSNQSITFWTIRDNGSQGERMRIDHIGNILFKGQSTTTNAESIFQNINSALNFFATQTISFSKDIGFFSSTTAAHERLRITAGGNILMSAFSAGNVIIGTTSDSGDRLRVTGGNGITFTDAIMTYNPNNDNRSGIAWRLGGVSIASITPNRRLRVNVGGVEYYIGAVEV